MYNEWLEKLDLCVELVHKVDVRAEDRADALQQLVTLVRSDAYCRSILVMMIAWRLSQVVPDSVGVSTEVSDQQYGQIITRALLARLRAIDPTASITTVNNIITSLLSTSTRFAGLAPTPNELQLYAQQLEDIQGDDIDATVVVLAVGLIDPATAGDMINFIATEEAWKTVEALGHIS